LFTLIDTILVYNSDLEVPWLPIEVATSLLIDELMPMPACVPISTPIGFFIDLTEKDSLISSLYSEYQLPPLETSRESLFRDSGVKYIDLSTEEEEIMISLGDYFTLKSFLLNPPFTERVYINLIIEDLEAITYF
jgi:hypothetical protein